MMTASLAHETAWEDPFAVVGIILFAIGGLKLWGHLFVGSKSVFFGKKSIDILGSSVVNKIEGNEPQGRDFGARFRAMNDEELIEVFNKQVGNNAVVRARMEYLMALHQEFIGRGFDYSVIGGNGNFSIACKIRLNGKKIELL